MFRFLDPFRAIFGFKVSKKSKYDTKVFCCINSIWVSKNAFDADCKSFEIIAKKSFIQKSYMRNTFAYINKSI
jgi:hypothetical protein